MHARQGKDARIEDVGFCESVHKGAYERHVAESRAKAQLGIIEEGVVNVTERACCFCFLNLTFGRSTDGRGLVRNKCVDAAPAVTLQRWWYAALCVCVCVCVSL